MPSSPAQVGIDKAPFAIRLPATQARETRKPKCVNQLYIYIRERMLKGKAKVIYRPNYLL